MTLVDHIRAPLFVPADRPGWIEKALGSAADAIILDLEDAVADERKDAARNNLKLPPSAVPFVLRINGSRSDWYRSDVAAIGSLAVTAVMLPMAESPSECASLASALPGLPLFALVETALGLSQARAIAAVTGVARLAFGSVDYCADLGLAHEPEALLHARSELVLASRLAGLAAPIDGVTMAFGDTDALLADVACGRKLGMGGKLCIHPGQTSQVRSGYAPTAREIAWARAVLEAGDGAVSVAGKLVDGPVRIAARKVLDEASLAGSRA